MPINKLTHKDFIRLSAQKLGVDEGITQEILDKFLEVFYDAMKSRNCLTIEHFGGFYIEDHSESTAFKFNPSQKLKAVLGWSNNYKGSL